LRLLVSEDTHQNDAYVRRLRGIEVAIFDTPCPIPQLKSQPFEGYDSH